MAVSHHLQGWFESSTRRYADTVQVRHHATRQVSDSVEKRPKAKKEIVRLCLPVCKHLLDTKTLPPRAQIAPTNMDCFIGAALAYHFDVSLQMHPLLSSPLSLLQCTAKHPLPSSRPPFSSQPPVSPFSQHPRAPHCLLVFAKWRKMTASFYPALPSLPFPILPPSCTQLSGCDEAARSLRTFLRLLRQQGPIHRRQVRCQRAPTQHMSHNTFGLFV